MRVVSLASVCRMSSMAVRRAVPLLPMTLPLQLGDALAGGEQDKGKNFRIFIGQPLGLRLSECAA